MAGKRAETVLEMMFFVERFTLNRAWNALSDDEFLWEPSPDAWSIRPAGESRTPTPFVSEALCADFDGNVAMAADGVKTFEPLTSIAWLFWHVGSMPARLTDIDFVGGDRTMASGWTSPYLTHHPIFTSAAHATGALRDGWADLRAVIERTTDEQFEARAPRYTYTAAPMRDGLCVLGPPGPAHPATFFVAGTLNEVSHHASQICTLRDLHAHRAAR
jgi:hypothetical protein